MLLPEANTAKFIFTVGGDESLEQVTTLPNILRKYSPDLYGYSTSRTLIFSFINLPNTRLNVAKTGGQSHNMLNQAKHLVRKIKRSDKVDISDWKVITIFIGGNDVCDYCNEDIGGPDTWKQNVADALDHLKAKLPNTFVNLVQLPNMGDLFRETVTHMEHGATCQERYSYLCPCGTYGYDSTGSEFDDIIHQYQQKLRDLVDSGQYYTSDDFTVVLQPFFTSLNFEYINGNVDLSVLTSDCFHLSRSGNRAMAIGLWNNMFEKIGEKNSTLTVGGQEIHCPTNDEPYFATVGPGEFSKSMNCFFHPFSWSRVGHYHTPHSIIIVLSS